MSFAYLPKENLSLRPSDCPQNLSPVPCLILDPTINETSSFTAGRAPVALVQSYLLNMVTIYWGSKMYAEIITLTPILNMGSDCWNGIKIVQCPRLGCWLDQHPKPQSRFAADLASLWNSNSSVGREMGAFTALEVVVWIALVILKQNNLWTLLSFLMALAVWQPGHTHFITDISLVTSKINISSHIINIKLT